jgi:hypothetical protein
MDNIALGLVGLAVGQVASTVIVWLNGRNARAALSVAAENSKAALLAAAKVLDDRTARDRQWALEDRRELASTLAARVVASAAVIAATVETTASTLATKVASDHAALRSKVEHAEATATSAVDKLTGLVTENTAITIAVGKKADAAYEIGNHTAEKISDLNARLLAREPLPPP